jgi:hypothetical protein
MASVNFRLSAMDGIWLPAIIITIVNVGLFVALFAGIARR